MTGEYPGGGGESELPTPNTSNVSPFLESDPSDAIDLIVSSTGNLTLDKIREVTFSSLNSEDPPNINRGAFRGISLLFSLGKGHILRHVFNLHPDWVASVDPNDDKVKGKSLEDLIQNNPAYIRLFKEYSKIYSKLPNSRTDLLGLCNVEDIVPNAARPIAQLLLLLIISTKFEV